MQDLQPDFFDVPSPCRGVCKSDDKGYCQGCFRTRTERFSWLEFSSTEKKRVIKLCQQREKRRNTPKKTKATEPEPENLQPSLLDIKPEALFDDKVDENDFNDFEL